MSDPQDQMDALQQQQSAALESPLQGQLEQAAQSVTAQDIVAAHEQASPAPTDPLEILAAEMHQRLASAEELLSMLKLQIESVLTHFGGKIG